MAEVLICAAITLFVLAVVLGLMVLCFLIVRRYGNHGERFILATIIAVSVFTLIYSMRNGSPPPTTQQESHHG